MTAPSSSFASLWDKFLTLPDYVQVHKALGAIPSPTLGYERLDAWSGRYLEANDEQGFIKELLQGRPDAYFGWMKRENREGLAVMGERAPPKEQDTADVAKDLAEDNATFIDTHPNSEVHKGAVVRSLNVPARQVRGQLRRLGGEPRNRQEPMMPLARTRSRPGDVVPPRPGRHRQRGRLRHHT